MESVIRHFEPDSQPLEYTAAHASLTIYGKPPSLTKKNTAKPAVDRPCGIFVIHIFI
ncbi:hypothetical protein HMPREF9412_4771 [Paenibacillus sp. HGF5]|nr:hypothetical protein HMPREF9412_4771 [Paenibacillus sp. HGF5]